MNKKRNLILITVVSVVLVIFIVTGFYFIKNKSNKMEKLEINNTEKNDKRKNNVEDNIKNNEENNIKENNNEISEDTNSIKNTATSEEDVVNYFENNYNELNNNTWDSVKDKAKEYFITIADFIFYNGKINGYTFNDLSSNAKLKIISVALKIDSKIEKYIPHYKETISSNGNKIYIDAKEKLVTLYLDISTEICKNHENGCNTAKEIFSDVKDNCKIGWEFIKSLLSSGADKLKDWYEIYSGK